MSTTCAHFYAAANTGGRSYPPGSRARATPVPRNRPTDRALAGDSTTTIRTARLPAHARHRGPPGPALGSVRRGHRPAFPAPPRERRGPGRCRRLAPAPGPRSLWLMYGHRGAVLSRASVRNRRLVAHTRRDSDRPPFCGASGQEALSAGRASDPLDHAGGCTRPLPVC